MASIDVRFSVIDRALPELRRLRLAAVAVVWGREYALLAEAFSHPDGAAVLGND